MAAGKGYDHVPDGLEYPRGGRSEMDWDPKGQSRWYDMTSSSLPFCKYGSIDLLKEKLVSDSLIDSLDWWENDFIRIALA